MKSFKVNSHFGNINQYLSLNLRTSGARMHFCDINTSVGNKKEIHTILNFWS